MRDSISKSDLLRGIRCAEMSSMDRQNRAEFVISFVSSWIGQSHPDVGAALAQAAGIKYREAVADAPM